MNNAMETSPYLEERTRLLKLVIEQAEVIVKLTNDNTALTTELRKLDKELRKFREKETKEIVSRLVRASDKEKKSEDCP